MDETAANIIERENALADFDHAREDFEAALEQVPEEALSYRSADNHFRISDLVPYMTNRLTRFSHVIDAMRKAEDENVQLAANPEDEANPYERSSSADDSARPGTARSDLDEMEAAHDELASKLRDMAYQEFSRESLIWYSNSSELVPTSASSIIASITYTYRRLAELIAEDLESWRSTQRHT